MIIAAIGGIKVLFWFFVGMVVLQLVLSGLGLPVLIIVDVALALTLLFAIYRRLGDIASGDYRREAEEKRARLERLMQAEAEEAARSKQWDETDLPSRKDIRELADEEDK
ncbi:hypothetical protein ACFFK0_24850 [Paenibacillus chartarius]|uniref:DUF4229 domain-containing protein n=1 Tax=Paenibacillus chartarius TaxID=747481 RepID=A0ABV6DSK6_9BACL